jgi:hypothetical protein
MPWDLQKKTVFLFYSANHPILHNKTQIVQLCKKVTNDEYIQRSDS